MQKRQEGSSLVPASSLSIGMKCDTGDLHEEHDQAGGLKPLVALNPTPKLAFDQTKGNSIFV